jgi:hypothetical protein
MPNDKLVFKSDPSLAFYYVILDRQGQFWNISTLAFEAFDASHWTLRYVNILTEIASAGGIYTHAVPNLPAGSYTALIYRQGVPAPTNTFEERRDFDWDGAHFCADYRIRAKTDTLGVGGAGVTSGVDSDNVLTIVRGDTFSCPFTLPADASLIEKAWFAIKKSKSDSDAVAKIMVVDGALTKVNGAAPVAGQTGSLTLAGTNCQLDLSADATAALLLATGFWDLQIQLTSGDAIETVTAGSFVLDTDVVRATS